MYNLLIGRFADGIDRRRVLEHTDDAERDYIAPDKVVDLSRLMNLPTLMMPETQDEGARQIARIGHVENLVSVGGNYKFKFVPNPHYCEIESSRIETAAAALRINTQSWGEFSRTHWAVKAADLYRVLQEFLVEVKETPDETVLKPSIFTLPTDLPLEPDLVAVMMPFNSNFTSTYDAIKAAVKDAGMRCSRADDIWVNNHIMDDVISLIWRARIVISDLTQQNANVFYETGIAHTVGRDIIQVAQSMDDIPFDLQGIRSITYLNNREGLKKLKEQVTSRVKHITGRY